MTTYQKNNPRQVIEGEVMFHDIDPVLYGDLFRVQPTPSSEYIDFSFSDFAQWLSDTGRIDHCDHERQYLYRDRFGWEYSKFLKELTNNVEMARLLADYLTCQNITRHV